MRSALDVVSGDGVAGMACGSLGGGRGVAGRERGSGSRQGEDLQRRREASMTGARQLSVSYSVFYRIKPLVPRALQIYLRRIRALNIRGRRNDWPIDVESGAKPDNWAGWPEGKQFALVLTHDVESARGQAKCLALMNAEKELGVVSSFNFVAQGYPDSAGLRATLGANGFEVGVHGLHHDGTLYASERTFKEDARLINVYLKQWNAVGFRSPSMFHNLDWIHNLDLRYDASTFDTDPFEPQADAVGTIFPFWVPNRDQDGGYVELPYTLSQDFTVFVVFQERSIDLWKRKLDWIAENEGMALLITHPDYICFEPGGCRREEYPLGYYQQFLEYVNLKYRDRYWNALPRDVACFWAARYGTGGARGQA